MGINNSTLTSSELINLRVMVADSADPTLRGRVGIVRDETRNMLIVESERRLVSVPKEGASFIFDLPEGQSVRVEGSRLRFRPEDRVKRGLTKW